MATKKTKTKKNKTRAKLAKKQLRSIRPLGIKGESQNPEDAGAAEMVFASR